MRNNNNRIRFAGGSGAGYAGKKIIYRNCLKNRNYAEEAPQNFDSERATIAEWQGARENRNCEVKPTTAETDSSDYFGIYPAYHADFVDPAYPVFFLDVSILPTRILTDLWTKSTSSMR